MRIAIDGQLLGGRYSGVERCILELVRHLQALDSPHHFVLYVPRDFREPLPASERWTVRRTEVPPGRRAQRIFWQQWVLPRQLERDRIDLLHGPGYILPWRVGRPAVVTIYDLIALQYPAWCRRSNVWHYRLLLPRSARQARAVIVPSAATRTALQMELRLPAERIHLIPPGVPERFQVLSDPSRLAEVRRKYGLPERFVLFVGNIEPKKNLETALQAFAALRRRGRTEGFVIVSAKSWADRAVRQTLAALGKAVQDLGYVPDSDLPGIYNLAQVLVFPSLVEGFGLPPLEAMACGTPVVTSNRPALPEVVGEAALQVEARDVGALAAALELVLTDADLRREMIQRGLERAARFSWKRAAERTMEVYQKCLG